MPRRRWGSVPLQPRPDLCGEVVSCCLSSGAQALQQGLRHADREARHRLVWPGWPEGPEVGAPPSPLVVARAEPPSPGGSGATGGGAGAHSAASCSPDHARSWPHRASIGPPSSRVAWVSSAWVSARATSCRALAVPGFLAGGARFAFGLLLPGGPVHAASFCDSESRPSSFSTSAMRRATRPRTRSPRATRRTVRQSRDLLGNLDSLRIGQLCNHDCLPWWVASR